LTTVETTDAALEAAEIFFQYYRENANYLERSYDFVERIGMEKIRKETIYASTEVKEALLSRLLKSKDKSYDAWLERYTPRPSQFVNIQPMEALTV
ncbi:MAG: nitrite reductase large subunit, partial [Chloroflexia bacterium]